MSLNGTYCFEKSDLEKVQDRNKTYSYDFHIETKRDILPKYDKYTTKCNIRVCKKVFIVFYVL